MSTPDQETLKHRLGEALRKLREGRSLTEAEVARRMGESPSAGTQISRWERGDALLAAHQLWGYLIAVDASFADLGRELAPATAINPRLREIARELDSLAPETPPTP